MIGPDSTTGFRKWRLFARVVSDTEHDLGSLPMVLVTPIVAAVFATVVAITEPAARVIHDEVQGPSLWVALRYAVEGAAGAIVLVIGALGLYELTRYRLRGDPVWKSSVEVVPTDTIFLHLVARAPADAGKLVGLQGILRTPDREWHSTSPYGNVTARTNPEGRVWRLQIRPEAGRYVLRWYASTDDQRFIELARHSFALSDPTAEIAPNEVQFTRADGARVSVAYEGAFLFADPFRERVLVLDRAGSITVFSDAQPYVIDDDEWRRSWLQWYPEVEGRIEEARHRKARELSRDPAGGADSNVSD